MHARSPTVRYQSLTSQIIQGILVALMVLLSVSIFVFFIYHSWINANLNASFADMITGSAHRPYVTRVLVPWLTRGIAAVLPPSIHQGVESLAFNDTLIRTLLIAYRTPAGYALEALISMGFQLLSILGFAFAFRGLYQKVFKTPALVPEMFTLVALIGLTPMLFYGYMYDFPSLFLSTLGLYAIAIQRKALYFVVLALAIFNKETSIVLVAPAILLFWDWPRPSLKKVLFGTLEQLGLYFAIRLPIAWIYRNNPGENLENHIVEHVIILRDYPVMTILSVVVTLIMLWLAFNRWRKKPALIMFGTLPGLILLAMFLTGGYPFEIRVFYDVYAAGFISMLYTMLLPKTELASQWLTAQDWLNSLAAMISRMIRQQDSQIPSTRSNHN